MAAGIGRVGVLVGGGDAPGVNAVLRAVVMTGSGYGWDVVGIDYGIDGLLREQPQVRSLRLDDVEGILSRGGSILRAVSRGPFTPMLHGLPRDDALYRRVAQNVRELGIDALVVIGGDSSQWIASHLGDFGVRAIGVAKTIDNDLHGTDRAVGFDTAVGTAAGAVHSLRDTVDSHERLGVLQVMGRGAGWIALHAGVAGGADVILIPEIPFDLDVVAARVLERDDRDQQSSVVVVAEGATEDGEDPVDHLANGTHDGIGNHVAAGMTKRTGKEARVVVLGHLQRGGEPTPADRILATRTGIAAVERLAEGRTGEVVVLRGSALVTIPMAECAGRIRSIAPDDALLAGARRLGISFGDEPASTVL